MSYIMNFDSLTDDIRSDKGLYFKALSEKINADLSEVVTLEFPPNLYNPMKYVLSSGGKRFRPILVIFACESVGGSVADAYNAALAIEILHNFTLVHDDIMDDDDLRRGRETVHKKWDESIAILAGDGLIALAYRHLLQTKSRRLRNVIRIFSEAIINICEGQSLDKDMEDAEDVRLADYLHMIDRKTGVLMAISTEIGAIIGKGTAKQVRALNRFGLELGIAFQIQDDLLDIISEENVLGKDLGSDLSQGKKTYPILHFIERASRADSEFVRNTLRGQNAGEQEIEKIRQLLYDYKIVQETKDEVNRRLDRADGFLRSLSGTIHTDYMLHLSGLIRHRKY